MVNFANKIKYVFLDFYNRRPIMFILRIMIIDNIFIILFQYYRRIGDIMFDIHQGIHWSPEWIIIRERDFYAYVYYGRHIFRNNAAEFLRQIDKIIISRIFKTNIQIYFVWPGSNMFYFKFASIRVFYPIIISSNRFTRLFLMLQFIILQL